MAIAIKKILSACSLLFLFAGVGLLADEIVDYGDDDPNIEEWQFAVPSASSLTAVLSGKAVASWQIEGDDCTVEEVFADGQRLNKDRESYSRLDKTALPAGTLLHALLSKPSALCKVNVQGLIVEQTRDAQDPKRTAYSQSKGGVRVFGNAADSAQDSYSEADLKVRPPLFRTEQGDGNAEQSTELSRSGNVVVNIDQSNANRSRNEVKLYITNIINGDQRTTEVSENPPKVLHVDLAENPTGYGDLKEGQIIRNADGSLGIVTRNNYPAGTLLNAGGVVYKVAGSATSVTAPQPVSYSAIPPVQSNASSYPQYEPYLAYVDPRPEMLQWTWVENKRREQINFARYNQAMVASGYYRAPAITTAPRVYCSRTNSPVYYAGYVAPKYNHAYARRGLFGLRRR